MNTPSPPRVDSTPPLSSGARWWILAAAFLGWLGAGTLMAITSLAMPSAVLNFFGADAAAELRGEWIGFLTAAFLFGAATGGYLLGWVGDRLGRAKGIAVSVLVYSIGAVVASLAASPWQLLAAWYLACWGIGGMWPNGIALVAEAWPSVSRPVLAGAIGTAANLGILAFAALTLLVPITPDAWRWTMASAAWGIVLGAAAWWLLPESPKWLATRAASTAKATQVAAPTSLRDLFEPAILRTTLIGILIGAVPLFGGWGVANWANAWASEYEHALNLAAGPSQSSTTVKSMTLIYRSAPGTVSSLLGGGLAFWLGRRRSYFLLCAGAFVCTQFAFREPNPNTDAFKWWFAGLGLFSGFFFGWLPLCLPEMFPTRVRSMGAGVSYNFGRILTGIGVLASALLLKNVLAGHFEQVGLVSGFVYVMGMAVIFLAPREPAEQL